VLGIRSASLLAGSIIVTFAVANIGRAGDAPVSFSRDIAPILAKSCQACHSPAEASGGYQVANYNAVLKAGDSGTPAVTAGNPEESELLTRISTDDESLRMPQESDPLPAEQVALVRRWIAEGAKYDGADPAAPLSAIMPKLVQPDPPETYRRPVPISAVALSHDGQEVAVGGYHEVTLWNVASGSLVRRIKNVPQQVQAVDYRADGTLLAVAGGTPGSFGEAKLFDPADGRLVQDLGSMSDVAFCAVFNPAGDKLAVGGADRTIRIYDVATGKQEILIEDHADWVVSLAWSADGKRLASASRDKTSKLFDATNGDSVVTYSGHGDAVFGVGFSSDGKLVFSAGADKAIHAWNPDDGAKKAQAGGFNREVLTLLTHEDKIFTGSADKSVQQHRGAELKHFKTYDGSSDAVFAVDYHPGTGRLAAGNFSGQVRVWNAEDGAEVSNFIAAPGYNPPVAAK
jgi:WD40 repeat protein/mono/diheme cytochrome c family protein